MTEDEMVLSILLLLRKEQRENSNGQSGWLPVSAVAQALVLDAELVRDEMLLLAADGEVKTKESPDRHPSSMIASITLAGETRLARLAKAKRAQAERPFAPQPGAKRESFDYDALMSHASDDAEYASALADELDRIGLKVWYDRDRIGLGDSNIARMNDGLKRSRHGIIIASLAYFERTYTKPECEVLLNRELNDASRKNIPVLLGMSQAQLRDIHPLLSRLNNLEAAKFQIPQIAQFLRGAFLPPTEADIETDEAAMWPSPYRHLIASAFVPGERPGPTDMLPEQEHLLPYRPDIEIAWTKPRRMNGVETISWRLSNVGFGEAKDVGVFLAGLSVYLIPKIRAQGSVTGEHRLDDRYAYYMIMKPPVHAIVESADVHGNLYRQYADVEANPNLFGNGADYKTTELGHPYAVSNRIVVPDEGDRFHLTAALDWPPIA